MPNEIENTNEEQEDGPLSPKPRRNEADAGGGDQLHQDPREAEATHYVAAANRRTDSSNLGRPDDLIVRNNNCTTAGGEPILTQRSVGSIQPGYQMGCFAFAAAQDGTSVASLPPQKNTGCPPFVSPLSAQQQGLTQWLQQEEEAAVMRQRQQQATQLMQQQQQQPMNVIQIVQPHRTVSSCTITTQPGLDMTKITPAILQSLEYIRSQPPPPVPLVTVFPPEGDDDDQGEERKKFVAPWTFPLFAQAAVPVITPASAGRLGVDTSVIQSPGKTFFGVATTHHQDADSPATNDESSATTGKVESAAAAAPSKRKRKYNHESFPQKLHRLIMDAAENGSQHIVHFTDNGTKFKILSAEGFEKILPKYFRHKKISSFSRMLHLYDFKRVQGTWYVVLPGLLCMILVIIH